MANPHLDGGQPWGSSTVTSPIVKNQVSPGHPSGDGVIDALNDQTAF